MTLCKTSCASTPSLAALASHPRSLKPLIALLTRLVENREERDRSGFFLCDGLRAAHRIAESPHFHPALFLHCPELLRCHVSGPDMLKRLRARFPDVPAAALPMETISRLSLAPEPQGIVMIVRQEWTPLYRLPPDAGLCYLALDSVRNAGNLGTVLRTLEAVGGAGLVCLPPDVRNHPDEPAADPFAPGVVRAAMGATFSLRFARIAPRSGSEWTRWRQKHGMQLVGTSPHTGADYRAVRYSERTILWVGSERKGLSDAQRAECDLLVRIPMAPTAAADSLNLATATSVLLYEIFRQRFPNLSPENEQNPSSNALTRRV